MECMSLCACISSFYYTHWGELQCKQIVCWWQEASSIAVLWWKGSSKIVLPLCCLQSHVSCTYCIYASTLNYQNTNSLHPYRGLPTSGCDKMGVTTYYSYLKSIQYIQFYIGSLISTDMVIDRTTSTYFTQLQPEYSTTVYTAVSTSYYTNSVPTVNAVSTLVSHTTMASVIATTISTTSPTGTQQVENSMIVMISAHVVLVVIIVIIIMIVTLIIIFTWWRRSHKNTHSVQYPAVTTSDEIVELHQNECYMTTKGDKRQEYKYFANRNIILCTMHYYLL